MTDPKIYVVLDMNGIFADFRRREARPVTDVEPIAVLNNGHKVYLHPQAGKFLQWVSDLPNVKVITYTSRLKKNAEPVELLLRKFFSPIARLYGEDCKPAGTLRDEPYHPVKTLGAVISAIAAYNLKLYAGRHEQPPLAINPHSVIFVDDHPQRIESGGAHVVHAKTYDASDKDTEAYLIDAANKLRRFI